MTIINNLDQDNLHFALWLSLFESSFIATFFLSGSFDKTVKYRGLILGFFSYLLEYKDNGTMIFFICGYYLSAVKKEIGSL